MVAVAVGPGRTVRLGIQDPAELDRGMAVEERDAVVPPFGPTQQRPDLLARLPVVRGDAFVPRPGRLTVEPTFDPADVAPVAVGQIVPDLPDIVLRRLVEVGGDGGN